MAQAEYSVAVDISIRNAEAQLNRLQQQINGLSGSGSRVGQGISQGINAGVTSASAQLGTLQSRFNSINAGAGISSSLRGAQSQIASLESQLGRLGSSSGANIGTNISRSVSGGVNAAQSEIARLNKSIEGTGSALSNVGKQGGGISGLVLPFKSLAGAAIATTAVLGGAGLTGALIKTAASFQDMRSALNTVYGSVEKGEAAFKIIQDFAVETPFDVEQLTKAFITLKAQGLNPTKDLLMTFSDAASVTTDRVRTFDALVRITSRSLSGGLGLMELEQVASAGIPVFDILEKKLGITRLQVSEFGKDAAGAQKILTALVAGLNERFGGSTEKMAGNLSVALSNLGDAAANAMDVIGRNGLGQAINDVATDISNFIENNHEAAVAIGQGLGTAVRVAGGIFIVLANNIGLVTTALGAMAVGKTIGWLSSLGGLAGIATKAMGGLRIAIAAVGGPIGIAAAALTALGVVIYKNWDYVKGFAGALVNNLGAAFSNVGAWIVSSTKKFGIFGSAVASFLTGNLSAFSGLGAKLDAVTPKYKGLVSATQAGSKAAADAAAAEKRASDARRQTSQTTKDAAGVQREWNGTFNDSLNAMNNGKKVQTEMTEAQKKHADSVKQFTEGLKDQISNLQIDIATMGQSNAVHDQAVRLRDAEKLGIAGQTAALRAKITALQQEKAEKQFAGNFQDYIKNLNSETAALSLNRKEREIALEILRQENAAKAAGANLTPLQKKQLEEALRANQRAKEASQARDSAEDESARKAIERQKELQDAINGTSSAYGNAGNAANNMFSQGGSNSAGYSIGQAIVESIFGKGQKVQYNQSNGTYTDQSRGSQLLEAIFGKQYSQNYGSTKTVNTIPTINGSTIGIGQNGQVVYNTGTGSLGGVNITVHNTGNPIDSQTLNQIVTSVARSVREEMTNEQRPNGLLYR